MDTKTQAIFQALKVLLPHVKDITAEVRTEIAAHVTANGPSEQAQKVIHLVDIVDKSMDDIIPILNVL